MCAFTTAVRGRRGTYSETAFAPRNAKALQRMLAA